MGVMGLLVAVVPCVAMVVLGVWVYGALSEWRAADRQVVPERTMARVMGVTRVPSGYGSDGTRLKVTFDDTEDRPRSAELYHSGTNHRVEGLVEVIYDRADPTEVRLAEQCNGGRVACGAQSGWVWVLPAGLVLSGVLGVGLIAHEAYGESRVRRRRREARRSP
jgi:hypothetical protein